MTHIASGGKRVSGLHRIVVEGAAAPDCAGQADPLMAGSLIDVEPGTSQRQHIAKLFAGTSEILGGLSSWVCLLGHKAPFIGLRAGVQLGLCGVANSGIFSGE